MLKPAMAPCVRACAGLLFSVRCDAMRCAGPLWVGGCLRCVVETWRKQAKQLRDLEHARFGRGTNVSTGSCSTAGNNNSSNNNTKAAARGDGVWGPALVVRWGGVCLCFIQARRAFTGVNPHGGVWASVAGRGLDSVRALCAPVPPPPYVGYRFSRCERCVWRGYVAG